MDLVRNGTTLDFAVTTFFIIFLMTKINYESWCTYHCYPSVDLNHIKIKRQECNSFMALISCIKSCKSYFSIYYICVIVIHWGQLKLHNYEEICTSPGFNGVSYEIFCKCLYKDIIDASQFKLKFANISYFPRDKKVRHAFFPTYSVVRLLLSNTDQISIASRSLDI